MKLLIQRGGAPVRMSEERFYLVLLAFLAALVAVIVIVFDLGLHRNFLMIAIDSALMQSTIVNTAHGNWFSYNGPHGPNLLAAHTTFILLLLIPIYLIAPSIDTLLIVQVIGVYSTIIPLYLLAKDLLQRPLVAFCVAASALASPFLLHMAMAPSHPETWIAAAVLWSYFFYLRNNLIGFCGTMLFAFCCGEQAALIYLSLSAALFLVDDGVTWRKQYARIAFLAGIDWILLDVLIVSPLARSPEIVNIFAYNYSQWHINSALDLPMAVVTHPLQAYKLLTDPFRWAHLISIIGLPLFVAFFSRRSLILLAPLFLYFMMSDQEFFLYFHAYYYTFAFFAGYLGVMLFLAQRAPADRLAFVALAGTFFFNILLLCPASNSYIRFEEARDDDFSKTIHQVFETIPTDAGVYSPHRYSAYLSNRDLMVIGDLHDENLDFKAMMDAQYGSTHVHPEQIDFIVCDYLTDQCGWRQGYLNPDTTKIRQDNIDRLRQSGQWATFFDQNDLVILQRVREPVTPPGHPAPIPAEPKATPPKNGA